MAAAAALLLIPAVAQADRSWLSDLSEARSAAQDVIEECRADPVGCFSHSAHHRLAEAFVVRITWAEVVDGGAAPQDVANLHFLAPNLAAPWMDGG